MSRVPSSMQLSRMQRGAVSPVAIAAVVIVVILALAAWFLIFQPNMGSGTTEAVKQPTGAATGSTAAPAPTNVSAMGVDELLNEAKKAMNDKRFIAPAGNNAFEYYLKVLEKQPGNLVAQDALRETFPFGASAAEQDINANNFDEGQREIDLLAKADPGNYTLTILRSKLDAQRKLAARAEEQQKRAEEVAKQQSVEPAAQPAGSTSQDNNPPRQAAPSRAEVASSQRSGTSSAPARGGAQSQPQQTPPEQAAPAQPAGPTRAAQLVKSTRPHYPPVALRRRQQGWVDVEFTVDVNGNVTNAHAVGSNRGRIFERAATDAVEQWKFQPALRNGQPVSSVLRQRIEFKL